MCLSETDKLEPPVLVTAPFAYARLRLEEYTKKQLGAWRARFDEWTSQGLDVYAYCKHEDAGKGPQLASRLLEVLAAGSRPAAQSALLVSEGRRRAPGRYCCRDPRRDCR